MAKKLFAIRLSAIDEQLMNSLRNQLGATQGSVIAMGLRELAKKEKIPIPMTAASSADNSHVSDVNSDFTA